MRVCVCDKGIWGGEGNSASVTTLQGNFTCHSEAEALLRVTPVEDLQTRRTLSGDQLLLKGRCNLGDKPTIQHHDPGGRIGVKCVVGKSAAAWCLSSMAVGRSVDCVLGD